MDRRQLLNDNQEALRLAMDGRQSSIWTAIPGIIETVNLAENTCTVQPVIQGLIEHDDNTQQWVNLPQLIHVPIVFPRAGGFAMTFPIMAGDEVLVVFASRCIDAWWQSGGIQKPIEFRMHDLSDGFAIPGAYSQPNKLANISASEAQLRNVEGDAYIGLTADKKIKLVAPGGIEVTGDIVVTGEVTADEVTADGIELSTHLHSGVTVGAGNTGVPVP